MKMRLINLLIVVLAVGGLAGGAYLLGSRVNDDANDALTPSLPAEIAAASANATLRPALFAANTYYVERSTYAGMTGDALRSYDQGLAEDLEVSSASATGFSRSRWTAARLATPAETGSLRPVTAADGSAGGD